MKIIRSSSFFHVFHVAKINLSACAFRHFKGCRDLLSFLYNKIQDAAWHKIEPVCFFYAHLCVSLSPHSREALPLPVSRLGEESPGNAEHRPS